MLLRVCYLDGHETGLCCYLVIHTEKPIISITAVLLPIVTYFLTLSHMKDTPANTAISSNRPEL
jgi:hypothetical protein